MSDQVEHPRHYNAHPSGVECITVAEHFGFCLGNAIKYIWRAGLKPGAEPDEDLKKARWYLDREIARRAAAAGSESPDPAARRVDAAAGSVFDGAVTFLDVSRRQPDGTFVETCHRLRDGETVALGPHDRIVSRRTEPDQSWCAAELDVLPTLLRGVTYQIFDPDDPARAAMLIDQPVPPPPPADAWTVWIRCYDWLWSSPDQSDLARVRTELSLLPDPPNDPTAPRRLIRRRRCTGPGFITFAVAADGGFSLAPGDREVGCWPVVGTSS